MFKDTPVFSTFAVDDLDAAEQFYGQTLGLKTSTNHMGLLQVTAGEGTGFVIYPKLDHTPAVFTLQNFRVKDIDKAVDNLTEHGVAFEHYDNELFRTDERGISSDLDSGMKIAWFTDPAGNILSIIQE